MGVLVNSYVPQQLFNMCAVSVGKIGAVSGETIESVSRQLTKHYDHTYQDEYLAEDIAVAAKDVSDYLRSAGRERVLVDSLTQMQFCIKHFQPDGKNRPFKLFGGTWFNKESAPLEDKPKKCLAQILAYNLRVVGGSTELAFVKSAPKKALQISL